LKALAPLLARSKPANIVHDDKLFQLPWCRPRSSHATQFFLSSAPAANHKFAEVVWRQLNAIDDNGGGPATRDDTCSGFAPALHAQADRAKARKSGSTNIELPARAGACEYRAGWVGVWIPRARQKSQFDGKGKSAAGKRNLEAAGSEFNVNSRAAPRKFLFDKLHLQPNAAARKSKGRGRPPRTLYEECRRRIRFPRRL